MDIIDISENINLFFTELDFQYFHLILPLDKQLRNHCKSSPAFMNYENTEESKVNQEKRVIQKDARYFVAKNKEQIIAYIKIRKNGGESYISNEKSITNICGAYCLPEYRGKNIFQVLLNFTMKILKRENYLLLGVDFESFNPTAYGFWLKYFTEYTHSVVRRIDDRFI
jgi:GNAT superfamily N-acetyltransferase